MPHAALTAAAPADPAACLPPPPSTAKPRANPNRGLDRRTTHGNHGAHPRARNRFRRTLLRISRAEITRDRDQAHLRPGFAARLCGYPRVLMPPPRPRGGITEAEDHAMCHAVTASLAPRAAVAEARRGAYTNASSGPPARPPVPIAPYSGDSHPERELAAHAAGLRAPANRPPRGAPTPGPTAPFKPSRTDPLNREPTAKSSAAPFKPFRTDPLNREPTAKPGRTAPFKPSRIDPLNREPTTKPTTTAPFKPYPTDLLTLIRSRRAPQPRRAQGNPVKQATPGEWLPWAGSQPAPIKGDRAPSRLSGQRPDFVGAASS
jgi:hypothetical protein